MQPNVIYLSDASYDPFTGHAGIGIKNLYSGEDASLCIRALGSQEAEEYALIEAISHAIEHGYRNCVFVYDNITIDTHALKQFYGAMFEHIQFMWFKREYLNVVDRLAAMAKPTARRTTPLVDMLIGVAHDLSDSEFITMWMPYTRGDVYGFLCSLSSSAPMYKALPKGYTNNANKVVLALLWQFGSLKLKERLSERYGKANFRKHKWFESFLLAAGFNEHWVHEARRECQGLKKAA